MNDALLLDGALSQLIEGSLREDIGTGDMTSDAVFQDDDRCQACIVAKEDGIVAGLHVVAMVFEMCELDGRMILHARDGERIQSGKLVAELSGRTKAVLRGERTSLNYLQRMSGIATITNKFVEAVAGTGARITDTRKTAPGLRALDKQAVAFGGGVNHRFGLDDMILIKDNHIAGAGSISVAVERCRAYTNQMGCAAKIEVETTNLREVREALDCEGVDRIMLDNFAPEAVIDALQIIGGEVETEASGGITLENIRSFAETGVDFISIGALTHSVRAMDFSLRLQSVVASSPS